MDGHGGSTSSKDAPTLEKEHLIEQLNHLQTKCALYEAKFVALEQKVSYIEQYLASWDKKDEDAVPPM